jgi:hypothetical protein
MEAREPGQVRKEAALSGNPQASRACRTGVPEGGRAAGTGLGRGCTVHIRRPATSDPRTSLPARVGPGTTLAGGDPGWPAAIRAGRRRSRLAGAIRAGRRRSPAGRRRSPAGRRRSPGPRAGSPASPAEGRRTPHARTGPARCGWYTPCQGVLAPQPDRSWDGWGVLPLRRPRAPALPAPRRRAARAEPPVHADRRDGLRPGAPARERARRHPDVTALPHPDVTALPHPDVTALPTERSGGAH